MLDEAGYRLRGRRLGRRGAAAGRRDARRRPTRPSSPGGRRAEVAPATATGLILAADTVCSVAGEILNKPVDRADAERMIRLQEGRDTEVITGLCLYRAERGEWVGAVEISVVRFRPLDDAEREAYLDSRRWEGKAGAYGVQDRDPFVIGRPAAASRTSSACRWNGSPHLLRPYPSLTG